MDRRLPLVVERKDGSTFPIEVSLNYVAGGGSSIAFVTDITERQRAASALQERTEELEHRTTQLSRMAWDLTLAEHHAREQIARTLHDGVQQLLFIVSLNLDQQLQRDIELGAAPSELLSEAKLHLEATAAGAFAAPGAVSPVLQRSGLPATLTWLARWTQEKYRLTVRIDADPKADNWRKDIRSWLFESARELLFNAFKHSHADCVTLELGLSDDGQLSVTVTDTGVGFDPATLDDRSKAGQLGWGLFSLRERLTLLGGRVDIDSSPGRGTRVRLLAPRDVARVHTAARIDARRAPIASDAPEDRSAPANPLRILIVDDHAAIRTLREAR
jgi:signal transduction histidine kinase